MQSLERFPPPDEGGRAPDDAISGGRGAGDAGGGQCSVAAGSAVKQRPEEEHAGALTFMEICSFMFQFL